MQCKGNGISSAPLLAAERLEEFAPFSAGGRAVPLARSGDEVAAGDEVEAFFWGTYSMSTSALKTSWNACTAVDLIREKPGTDSSLNVKQQPQHGHT
jgi:hypothetical protein